MLKHKNNIWFRRISLSAWGISGYRNGMAANNTDSSVNRDHTLSDSQNLWDEGLFRKGYYSTFTPRLSRSTHDNLPFLKKVGTSQVAQWWRTHLPMQETQETQVWSLGQEDPLEEEMAAQSSILAWRIPWTEEPGRLQSRGSQSQRWLSNWAHTKKIDLVDKQKNWKWQSRREQNLLKGSSLSFWVETSLKYWPVSYRKFDKFSRTWGLSFQIRNV